MFKNSSTVRAKSRTNFVLIALSFFISLSAYAATPMIRIQILENVPEASVKLSSDGERTWLNGKPYTGKIVLEKSPAGLASVINTLPIEDYITGLLPAEMPANWPLEALKAQAVTARTYAYYVYNEKRKYESKSPYDLKSTVEDQVYNGDPYRDPRIVKAAKETEGEILTYHDKPLKTRFHSSCGGKTETSIHVWGENDISRSIEDPYCKNSPYNKWQATLSSREITEKLKKTGLFDPGEIRTIEPEQFEEDGRVAAVAVGGANQTISLTGNDFRRYIGFDKIKSTLFTITKVGAGFRFDGRGFGHGVGMCQWGAKGMAEQRASYKDILSFYYPGTTIKKIY